MEEEAEDGEVKKKSNTVHRYGWPLYKVDWFGVARMFFALDDVGKVRHVFFSSKYISCMRLWPKPIRCTKSGVGGIFIFGGGGLGTVGTIIMVIVVIIVIIYCCYCCVKNCGDKEGSGTGYTSGVTIPCYLCLSRIKEDIWESGYHRKVCADKNVTFLSTLPMPYPIKCPKCDKMMKQWPDRGPEVSTTQQNFALYQRPFY